MTDHTHHHEGEPRKAHHSEKFKKDVVSRLNRIEGQIRGITKMVAEDVYCDDILDQIRSVEAALDGVRKTLFEAHVKGCVIDQLKDGKYEVFEEFLVTIGRMLK